MRVLVALYLFGLPVAVCAADPIPYLPAETDAVLTIDAKKLAESELGKKVGPDLLKELIDISPPVAAAIKATGLDLLHDFDMVTIGVALDKTSPTRPFALLEGKFDAKKVEANVAAYMKENPKKLSAITVGEKAAYKVTGSKPTETMFAAIIDDTKLVVAATEKDLAGAFEAAAGGRRPVISKDLAGLLAGAKPSAPIFLHAWLKGKLKDVNLPNEKLKSAVQGVDWALVAIAVTKDVTLMATINTPDAASAQKLSDLLGAVVGLVRLQILAAAEDQPELRPVSDLLKATKVAPNGKTVVAYGMVKGEAIEKALAPPPAPKVTPVPKKK